MQDDAWKAALPNEVADRVGSALFADGRATVVLDATGWDAAERKAGEAAVRDVLSERPDIDEVRVALTAQKTRQRILAVASGKGGVGKSTVTANLAIALARKGHGVGVVDADIYGPSQPVLLATSDAKPEARDKKLVPVETPYGVTLLSMGHLAKPGQAIAWRGPMVGTAVSQLIDAHWNADLLIVDMPPGTGDVQLTMLSKFKPAGAVLVSTPQDLALIDAARAGQLFDQAGVPIIGLVENMAGYACPHCGEVSDPFGHGGVEAAAARLELPFLGRIPLELAIREGSDAGRPPAASSGEASNREGPFDVLAAEVDAWLGAN